jgi:hypothetical protein
MIRYNGIGMHHWSNGGKPARFLGMNGFTSIFIGGMLFYRNLNFWLFSIAVIAFLLYIEKVKKMTFRSFLRRLNVLLIGRLRSTQDVLRGWNNG